MAPRSDALLLAITFLAIVTAAAAAGCNGKQAAEAPAPAPQPEALKQTARPEFFGMGGITEKIVYVIDRSGSMTDSIMYVKYELRRSIRMLKPNQLFHVVFYSTGPAVEMPPRKLIPATEANKLAAYEFIDAIVPVGQTDPTEALKAAFRVKPDIIYFLTDGALDRKIPRLVEKLNADKKVEVHTFCFVYTAGEAVMREIAEKNGGAYKYISEDDLESLGR